MSGRYPHSNSIPKNEKNTDITAQNCLLGSLFQEAGYRTAMLGKWHVSQVKGATQGERLGGGG